MKDWFSDEEKVCGCGCGLNLVDINPDFLQALNTARIIYNKPMIAVSMTRCPKHNKEIGGAPDSAHLYGRAADIQCDNMVDRFQMIKALMVAGFRRFELKRGNVHADMKDGAPEILAMFIDGEIV